MYIYIPAAKPKNLFCSPSHIPLKQTVRFVASVRPSVRLPALYGRRSLLTHFREICCWGNFLCEGVEKIQIWLDSDKNMSFYMKTSVNFIAGGDTKWPEKRSFPVKMVPEYKDSREGITVT
jgi:hypothetical protein